MLKILKLDSENLVDGKIHARVDICVDGSDELVTTDGNTVFEFGSIAWVVSSGDFYGLKSDGTWVRQGASAPSEPEETTEEVEAGDT